MERDLDKKLYNDYLNGEKQAFEYLYSKYKSKIVYFIYNIVKDYPKAEDLTQETFIYIMQNKMKNDVSFKYHIYLVAKSKAFNYINVENRRNEIAEEYMSNNEQIENDVLDVITQEETKKELLESIELLDEKYKNAVYLVNIENLTYQETADILDETLQNTKNLVHRGKKQLRKILLKKGFDEMNKVSKVSIIIICSIILMTGVAYAGVVIYNEFIKKQDRLSTNELYTTEEGLYSNDFTKDMNYEESIDLYYKVITDEKEFEKYKNSISELSNIEDLDFNTNYLILIGNWGTRYPHENDLMISGVNADDKTTYITLKQKENPNYDKTVMTLYAIIDKETLKEDVKLKIESTVVESNDFVDIKSLSSEYTIDEALKDGCFVEENSKVLSENKMAIDKLIENAKNNVESFIRIYSKDNNGNIRIIDISYENGIYMSNIRTLNTTDIYTFSFKYLTKQEHKQTKTYEYGYNGVDRAIDAGFLLEISYE